MCARVRVRARVRLCVSQDTKCPERHTIVKCVTAMVVGVDLLSTLSLLHQNLETLKPGQAPSAHQKKHSPWEKHKKKIEGWVFFNDMD